jgi:CheY-like chemotaxis protein
LARILMIEDSELMRLTLRRVLEALGHEVMEAVNGVDGIQLQSEHNFDLVVTDIIMPEKGGVETIIELKEKFPDLRIITVSAEAYERDSRTLSRAQALGADEVVAKPFTAEDIQRAGNACLDS